MEQDGQIVSIWGWSLVPLQLEFFFNDTPLSKATGFCYSRNGRKFLVSAWHCFSGRNAHTHRPIDEANAGVPNCVKVLFPRETLTVWTYQKFDLLADGQPVWLEHDQYGSKVDVAVLVIDPYDDVLPRTADGKSTVNDMLLRPSLDVFIIGYPLGISVERLAVWKRATIASEPGLDVDGLPKFLIDVASTRGMSGSPVVARAFGFYANVKKEIVGVKESYTQFLGVYSGRLIAPLPAQGIECERLDAQLGIVWKRRVLDEIIDGGRKPQI